MKKKLRKKLLIVLLTATIFSVNAADDSGDSNAEYDRILGCGTVITYGSCDETLGVRPIVKRSSIFYIFNVTYTTTFEAC